jgi:chaperonin GroES
MSLESKIRPLGDRIVVKRLDNETTSAGGIVLPDSATEKPSQGTVLAVGNGKKLDNGQSQPLDVSVGDTVIFGQYSGNTVKIENQEVLIMNESEVFAVLQA